MSWSYRKSFGSSPFKINFSKKGISYSIGVKGARVNIGPKGTYVSLSSHGFSYRHKISGPATPSNQTIPQTQSSEFANNIASAHIEQLTDTDSKAFITELNQKSRQVSYVKLLGILPLSAILLILLLNSWNRQLIIIQPATDSTIVRVYASGEVNIRKEPDIKSHILKTVSYGQTFLLLDSSNHQWLKVGFADSVGYISHDLVYIDYISHDQISKEEWYLVDPYLVYELIICFTCFIPLIYWLKKVDKNRFEMELFYDMDDKYQQVYQQFKTHFVPFSRSSKIWQYLNTQCTNDHKRNAGAGKLIKRTVIHRVSQNKIPIPHFITNVEIPYLSLKNMELFFLPERLLIKRGNSFAAVFYKNLHITSNVTRFIESDILPHDAEVVDYTWQYVNKNGGPDRRFNNNRKLPICVYSEYMFKSDTGIFEVISTSKRSSMDAFAGFISKIGELQTRIKECNN